jgi:hypothetical protein
MLVILKEREPEFARRKSAGLREKLDEVDGEEPPLPEEPEAVEEEPVAAGPLPAPPGDGTAAARREARRKRRRARPHGRAR